VVASGARFLDRNELARAIATDPDLDGCLSTTCLERLATRTGAAEFLRAHVSASGNSYELDLELLSPRAEGGLAGRVQRSCSVCTVGDLGELVGVAARDLLAGRSDPDGALVEIACRPDGAELLIDGEPRGAAPFRGVLPPGQHRIVARLDGHADATRTIDVAPGPGEQRVEIALTPAAALDAGARPYRTWKWLTAGSAAAALVAGTALLILHGDGTCSAGPGACPEVYDTRAAGLASLALGLAAGATSAWMFTADR
jgi:hypothetical protein